MPVSRARIRVRVPEGRTTFNDLVHGPIRSITRTVEDFVIVRSDGQPTYQLSVVCDDIDMAITHVVRGNDHISNTPKQIVLYQALGAATPAFAHVPLILGADKKRLSKRHGATSVTEYSRQGYLPEAMMNFLALLGWSPGSDEEVFSREELVARFALEGISGGNAVFNVDKLDWFNAQHLARLSDDALIQRIRPELEQAGLWSDALVGERRAWFGRVLALLRPRAKHLGEFASQAAPFLAPVDELRSGGRRKAPGRARNGVAHQRARGCLPDARALRRGVHGGRAQGDGRAGRHQGGAVDSRDAHCRHGPCRQPRTVRDARAHRPRRGRRAARGAQSLPGRAVRRRRGRGVTGRQTGAVPGVGSPDAGRAASARSMVSSSCAGGTGFSR